MSFKIGGSKSKGSQSGTEDSTMTTTPNVPDWLLDPTKSSMANITKLGATDPASLVAPADALQNKGGTAAMNLSGSPWNYDAAADVTRGVIAQPAKKVEAASVLDNLDKYYSPFKQQITDPLMADFDANAGKTRAAQDLAIAGNGAFGGSGAALTKSATEGELARGRASTLGDVLSRMFTESTNLSGQDAGRRQAASESNANLAMASRAQQLAAADQLAGISSAYDANQRANIATQEAAGQVNRDIATETAQAPFNLQDWISEAIAKLNPALFTGETRVGNSKTTGTSKSSGFNWGVGASYGGSGKSAGN